MNSLYRLLFLSFFILNTFVIQAQSNKDIEDQIYIHLERAKDLKGILDYDEAIIHCSNAIILSTQIKDKEYEGIAYRVSGSILRLDNKPDDALIMLNKASRIQHREKHLEELARTRNEQGLIHLDLGNYKQALNYFDDGLRIYKSLQLFSNQTEILKNKGVLFFKEGNLKKANATLSNAHKEAEKFAKIYTDAEILLFKSKTLNGLQKKNQAIQTCEQAISIGKMNNFPWIITEGYKILSEIHESNNDPESAIILLKKYNTIRDSIYSVRSDRLTQEEIAKLNFADQDRRIEQQNLLIQQREEELKQSNILGFLGFLFLTLLFSFLIFLYSNIRKRKKANQLLQHTNNQLTIAKNDAEKATKAKANFLSTITHELRTPLYTVTGLTDLLLDENPTEAQKGYLKTLRFSGDYLLNFINDILDVNKIEANKIELEKIPFNLKKLSSEVLYALNKSAEDNNSTLELTFDNTIPEYLLGDSLRLSQILINLLSNAIKFTQDGSINLTIKTLKTSNNNIKLHIEVTDTGIGIPLDKQEEIFESFSQGFVQINRKYGGTGLGLTIVKNLLDLMGSKIQLKSTPGKGTCFYFDISFELAKKETIESVIDVPDFSDDFLGKLENKSILLADDVKINQLITKKTLLKKGLICTTADNGEEAVEKVKKHNFDLILMDIHMPGIGGIEAVKQIREFNKTIPIIALTAITIEKEDIIKFNAVGFNDILPKPFKSTTFFEKIYTQLTK